MSNLLRAELYQACKHVGSVQSCLGRMEEAAKELDQLRAELASVRRMNDNQTIEIGKLERTVSNLLAESNLRNAPRPAPRCPKCGTMNLHISYEVKGKWQVMCSECLHEQDGFKSIDAALDAWRRNSDDREKMREVVK